METTQPTKQPRTKGLIRRNRKKIIKAVLALVVLGATAGFFYNLGAKQEAAKPAKKSPSSSIFLDGLKDAAKKARDNAASNKPATTPPSATNSSGFFRLSGTVQSIKKETILLKLADGSVVTIVAGKDAKYYSGTPRAAAAVSTLKAGSAVTTIGTIGASGTFTTSNIQAQK